MISFILELFSFDSGFSDLFKKVKEVLQSQFQRGEEVSLTILVMIIKASREDGIRDENWFNQKSWTQEKLMGFNTELIEWLLNNISFINFESSNQSILYEW